MAALPHALPPYLERLREQHRNIERVLTLIRLKADSLRPTGGADLRLLAHAVAYMEGFPTQVHEPSEDLVCERLLSRAASSGLLLDRLARQRREFLGMEAELSREIHRARGGDPDAYPRMREAALAYCYRCAAHIYVEETELFRRARHALDESDWEELQREQERRFSQPTYPELRSYDSLYEFLMAYDPDRYAHTEMRY
jgi:hemerythrin-like domain-containing protein